VQLRTLRSRIAAGVPLVSAAQIMPLFVGKMVCEGDLRFEVGCRGPVHFIPEAASCVTRPCLHGVGGPVHKAAAMGLEPVTASNSGSAPALATLVAEKI
jgi:hypothetical protein